MSKGFYVTITTIDDSALYADWEEPLTPEILEKVINYFDVLAIDGLDTDRGTLIDIESIIGLKAKYADFS